MKLIYSPPSPYVRKVRIVLAELDLADRVALEFRNPWNSEHGLTGFNPLSRVPTLILDDGTVLFDSPVICEYLNDLAGGTLFPEGADHWRVSRLHALADGIKDAAVTITTEKRRPEGKIWDGWIARQCAVIERAADAAEADAADWGNSLTIGQIAMAAALAYVEFRHNSLVDWRAGRPALAAWHAAFSERPSMISTEYADMPAP